MSVTRPQSAVPGIERDAVGAWLGATLGGFEGPYAFERIGEGQSNLTYRVTGRDGTSVVLRRPPLGEILASAHDMSREHSVLSALSSVGAPVPATLAYCDDASVTGAPFYVMAAVDGLVLSTVATATKLDQDARRRVGLEMARTLATLHGIDPDAIGLAELRRPGSLIERQLRRWERQWHASRTRDLPTIDRLAATFSERMPPEREQVLVHGDYHLGNAIVGPEGTVEAVLDWELCTIGDPLADVGLMVAYWNELAAAADNDDVLFREPVTALPGFPTVDELVAAYAGATGRDLAGLGFWVAFAYWKVAIIVEGVYRRWLNDPANGSDAGTLQPAVDRLARLAEEALETRWSEVGSSRHDG